MKRTSKNWEGVDLWVRIVLFLATIGMIVTALFLPGATGIAVGLALGFVLSGRVPPFIAIAKPFAELGRAVLPLLLPLLLLVVIGTIQQDLAVQIAVDLALVLIAWHAIVRPDLKRLDIKALSDRPKQQRKFKILRRLLLPLLGVATAAVVVMWFRRDIEQFETRGGISSFLLLLTLILWSLAIALRLLSFATSTLRLIVALVLLVALLRLAMAVGALPGGTWLDRNVPWFGPEELAVAAVAALVMEFVLESVGGFVQAGSRRNEAPRTQVPERPVRGTTSGAASLGLGMALLATTAAGGAALAGLIETSDPGGDRSKLAIAQLQPPNVDKNRAADAAGRDIAARYFPVLAFTDAQEWTPQSVTAYLRRARMKGPDVGWEWGKPLPRSCRNLAPSPCFKLTIECAELGRDVCAPRDSHEHGELQRNGAVYVRILRRGSPPRDGSGNVFVERGPFRDRLRTLVQYWFFYPYDRWKSPLLAGRLVQEHEGDWEAVTLGLGGPRQPLFLAYSAHCGGHWKAWDDVEKADMAQQHPLVAVATGSHANYPKADRHQPPDWTSCKNLPSGATSLLTYAFNARDTTAYDWEWYPSQLIPVDGLTAPMSFPGRWGEDERIELTNFKPHPAPPGKAPLTPTLQPLWERPVMTVFCGRYEERDCKGPEPSS